jgi:hypothetical protein
MQQTLVFAQLLDEGVHQMSNNISQLGRLKKAREVYIQTLSMKTTKAKAKARVQINPRSIAHDHTS